MTKTEKIVKDPEESSSAKVIKSNTLDMPAETSSAKSVKELNGPKGLEPTRYGDWESKGRCYDF